MRWIAGIGSVYFLGAIAHSALFAHDALKNAGIILALLAGIAIILAYTIIFFLLTTFTLWVVSIAQKKTNSF